MSNLNKKLFVGNLSYKMTDQSLMELFAEAGKVVSARIINDHESGQSRGFGFVEMATADQMNTAITAFNGKTVDGRILTVNEAKPREPRSS